jgi:AcrR family transcriptional regulator
VLSAQPEASVEDIARAAGVSRQTVYAHFPSREGKWA